MGGGRGGREINRFEVTAGNVADRGGDAVRVKVNVRIGCCHEQGAGGLTGRNVYVAEVGDDCDGTFARIAQGGSKGNAGCILIHIGNRQADRGGVDGIGDGNGGRGAINSQLVRKLTRIYAYNGYRSA